MLDEVRFAPLRMPRSLTRGPRARAGFCRKSSQSPVPRHRVAASVFAFFFVVHLGVTAGQLRLQRETQQAGV